MKYLDRFLRRQGLGSPPPANSRESPHTSLTKLTQSNRPRLEEGFVGSVGRPAGDVADQGDRPNRNDSDWQAEVSAWSEGAREFWEERAAILEFEAGMSRADAEWLAFVFQSGLPGKR